MNKQVRMHSRKTDKAGILYNTGEIPGGCIVFGGGNDGKKC